MRLVFCCAMTGITVAMMIIAGVFYEKKKTLPFVIKRFPNIWFWIILAWFLRMTFTFLYAFYPKSTHTDMMYWIRWTEFLGENPLSGFYSQNIGDYTPIFPMYLKLAGIILNKTGLPFDGVAASLLYKLIPVTCDALSGLLIYYCAEEDNGLEAAIFYLFNPAVIFCSTIWGQIDSTYSLLIALSAICLIKKKIFLSGIVTALSVLIKLQTFFWGPIFIAAILCYLFRDGYSWKKCKVVIWTAAISIGVLAAGYLPFGIMSALRQTVFTLSEDPLAAINASNFWTMLGLNFVSQYQTFLSIPYNVYGYFAIGISSALCMYLVWKSREKESLFLYAGFLFMLIFTFSVRMRERYSFPALILLLLAYCMQAKREYWYWYVLLSVTSFANQAIVILIAKYDTVFNGILWITSVITVATVVWMALWIVKNRLLRNAEET